MGNPLWTIQELAEFLNISVIEVRRLVWSGQVGYIDLNKGGKYLKVRFTKEHIEDLLEKLEFQAG